MTETEAILTEFRELFGIVEREPHQLTSAELAEALGLTKASMNSQLTEALQAGKLATAKRMVNGRKVPVYWILKKEDQEKEER